MLKIFKAFQKSLGLDVYDMGFKTIRKLSYEELFDIVGDANYPIGKPELDLPGLGQCIRFAPGDTYQVVILTGQGYVSAGVTTSGIKGFGKMVGKDLFTNGMSSTIEMGGKQAEYVRAVKEIVRQRLEEHGLLAKNYPPVEQSNK